MDEILTWSTSTQGVIQKTTELGLYYNTILTQPDLGFPYTDIVYTAQNNTLVIDDQPGDSFQLAKVKEFINSYSPGLQWYKATKRHLLAIEHNSSVQALIGTASVWEVSSWYKQEMEARSFIADNNSIVPILSALVISRNQNESIPQLAGKIILKADQYAVTYANILGIYQYKQKQLESVITIVDVLEI